MPMPSSLVEARDRVLALASNDAAAYGWAARLPSTGIDEAATSYLNDASTAPETLVEQCNPFAVSDQLSEVSALYERAVQQRLDAHTLEASLLNEILDEDLADQAKDSQLMVETMAYLATVRTADTGVPAPPSEHDTPVKEVYRLISEARSLRRLYRGTRGHPFNLLEQLEQARERYFSTLTRLLAKAEAAHFVLRGSYGYPASSVLDLVRNASGENPLPIVDRWLRRLAIDLEGHASRERVVTVYRLLGQDGWVDLEALSIALKSAGSASLRVELDRSRLGIHAGEAARLLAIGAAPVFGWSGVPESKELATEWSAFKADLRANRETLSFDVSIGLEAVEYVKQPQRYNFPPVVETHAGIGAWGVGSGTASRSVGLRGSVRLTNRPIDGCFVNIAIDSTVRASFGVFQRPGIPKIGKESELTPTDVLLGVRFAAVPRL